MSPAAATADLMVVAVADEDSMVGAGSATGSLVWSAVGSNGCSRSSSIEADALALTEICSRLIEWRSSQRSGSSTEPAR